MNDLGFRANFSEQDKNTALEAGKWVQVASAELPIPKAARKLSLDAPILDDGYKNNEGSVMGSDTQPNKDKLLQKNWVRVKTKLKTQLGADVFESWFGRLKVCNIDGGVVLHTVPTAFLRSWISSKYRTKLLELWQQEDESVLRVDITIRRPIAHSGIEENQANQKLSESANQLGNQSGGAIPNRMIGLGSNPDRSLKPMATTGFAGSPLDPKHTFDSFIEGQSNRMVYAAARTIADDISASHFNPLFIHAGVGLGKTHVLQAIAWRARTKNPKAKVLYLTAEYFMWRFASAIRDKTALTLKASLRDIDILLIDDMQFLQGQAIQAEFCHLLNELIDSARQVIVAADRPSGELESLDERVRSRLKGGVTLEIKQPDLELRKKMLDSRYMDARQEQPDLDIPEDILHYVARQVASSGRDIEGAFNQILVQHQFSEGGIEIEDLDHILEHLVRSADAKRVRIEDIQRIVARQFNVSKNDLLSNRRTRAIVRPRQIAMYLSKVMTPRSLPEIGRRFGGRDHTTVLHAVRKIESLTTDDQKLAHEIELLKRLILE
ncbi:MAG: chromosomal replication initiator protein DnaA [Pseudomonadota bacterium]